MKTFNKRLNHLEILKVNAKPLLYDVRQKKREEYFRLNHLKLDLIQDIHIVINNILSNSTIKPQEYKHAVFEYVYYLETCGYNIDANIMNKYLDAQDMQYVHSVRIPFI